MNFVILNGSARANGNTFLLLSRLVNYFKDSDVNTEIINISDKKINFCLGCHHCEKTRACIQSDGVDEIYDSFKKADLICVASPSYWGDVTGQLKTFFDRSTSYCNTIDNRTTFPAGKHSCSIALRAGSAKSESEQVISSIKHYFSHLEIKHQFSATFEGIRSEEDLNTTSVEQKLKEFSKRVVQIRA